jgi:hypothetical protein
MFSESVTLRLVPIRINNQDNIIISISIITGNGKSNTGSGNISNGSDRSGNGSDNNNNGKTLAGVAVAAVVARQWQGQQRQWQ